LKSVTSLIAGTADLSGASGSQVTVRRSKSSLLSRHPLLIGLLAAALAAFFTCCAVAAVNPPLSTADETSHLDYAVQVWNGHLPVFEQGAVFKPPPPGVVSRVQLEAQHPPLFYALVAPIAGPLTNAGHWVAANLAVRLFNSILTLLLVLVVGWSALQLRPRDKGYALTAGAVVTTLGPVIFTGGSAFGDPLNTLLTAAAIGVAIRAVRFGLSRRLLLAAGILGAAGALTNAEFGFALVVLVLALAAAVLLHHRAALSRRWLPAAGAGALPVLTAALGAGWYYLRNRRLTGSLSGAQPGFAKLYGHPGRSVTEVLRDPGFQTTQTSVLRHPLDGRAKVHDLRYRVDTSVMEWLLAAVIAAGILVAVVLIVRAVRQRDRPMLISYALLTLLLVLDAGYQVQHAMTGGGTVSRYLLPALVPIVLVMAAGLSVAGPRPRTYLLGGYLLLCYGMFTWWLVKQPHTAGRTPTNVYWWAVLVIPAVLAVLLVLQVWMHQLTTRETHQLGGASPSGRLEGTTIRPSSASDASSRWWGSTRIE
jgi:hypothetical protein